MTENGTGKLAAALAEARKKFEPITRSKTVKVTTTTGGSYTFDYAPFEEIVGATADALAEHGLSVVQSAADGLMCSTLIHTSGESCASTVPLILPDKITNQQLGSALTYARRYGYSMLLCLTADDDDDGNAATGNQAEVTRKPQPRTAPKPTTSESVERWFWSSLTPMVAGGKWAALGMPDEASGRVLLQTGAVGDIARTTLMQKLLGRMPSSPPTKEDWSTAAAMLQEILTPNDAA